MDQITPMTPEITHQRFLAIEHHMAAQEEQFGNAIQRMSKQYMNSRNVSARGSTIEGNDTATGAAHVEVTSGHGLSSWYYPLVSSQPAFISPSGNFTFDGRQLPPLSAQYSGPIMMLRIPWGQQVPYQNYHVASPETQHLGVVTKNDVARNAQTTNQGQWQNTTFQIPPPVQTQQGPTMVPPQVIAQEDVPRITHGPQGTLGPFLQGPIGAGTNQGPTFENPERAGQNVQGSNDRLFIMYQDRAAPPVSIGATMTTNLADAHIPQGSIVVIANPKIAAGHPYGNHNGANVNLHNPQQQRFFSQRAGHHLVDLCNEFRQEPDATANVIQQQDFEVGVEQTLNAEEIFSRMVEDRVRKELGTEISEVPEKPYPDFVEWKPLPRNFGRG
ncbi:OLC1v1004965C1 [Oldenlandia corymbosa var. corymbosa]|uniref:OLC1v1004965C1 n=1 Tax=Oldenlandia corymbosa var. corymbosa TaxID=529605 RepID=A0AAV1DG83_OLDCO|nr:OLC1v1004965C1 [Oldenlandia corymbosa var. corymbosa]